VQLALVDSLRCPAHDEESALVLAVESWAGPRVAEGVLGCPVCKARYPIRKGTIHFAGAATVQREKADENAEVMRLAAQLGLTEPGGMILLTGGYATVHASLTELVEVTCLLVGAEYSAAPLAVNFVVEDRLPLVDHALRGAAVDADRVGMLTEVVRCTKPGGRIVAPAASQVPSGVRLVARDDREWVGEVDNVSTVQLRRSERFPNL
jgi:uncharacterized protein YbaR (Trm112 family)